MPTIGIVINDGQRKVLMAAASRAGSKLGPWMRVVCLAAARDIGIDPDADQRGKNKAEHAAGVAERRERRERRKAAIVAENAAWAELARCQEALSVALSGGDPIAIRSAHEARHVADAEAVRLHAARVALQA